MTLALIVLIVFLVVWFNQSADKRQKAQQRNKTPEYHEINLSTQEELFLKWFNDISQEIDDDTYDDDNQASAIGTLFRAYERHSIPRCWDASTEPSLEAKICGRQLESTIVSMKRKSTYEITSRDFIKGISIIYGKDDGNCSIAEKLSEIESARDWRLWLVHDELFCTSYKDWYKRDARLIFYKLFKKDLDAYYDKLLNAEIIKYDELFGGLLLYGRWVYDYSDKEGYYSLASYIPPKENTTTQKGKIALELLNGAPKLTLTRMQEILLNEDLRAYFLNLICLLTKRSLAEQKLTFTYWWKKEIKPLHLYVPTDEEASAYPWMFV